MQSFADAFGALRELKVEAFYLEAREVSVRKADAVAQFVLDLTNRNLTFRIEPVDLLDSFQSGYTELVDRCKDLVSRLSPEQQVDYLDFATEEVRNSQTPACRHIANTVRFTRSAFDLVHEVTTPILPSPSSSSSLSSSDQDSEQKAPVIKVNQKISLMLFGAAGAGKSTLTNEIFGSLLPLSKKAQEGVGVASVTDEIDSYSVVVPRLPFAEEVEAGADPHTPLQIEVEVVDTPGTTKSTKEAREDVDKLAALLVDRIIEGIVDPKKKIDILIYTVNGNDPRIQLFDVRFVEQISKYVPVCLVFAQSSFPKTVEAVERSLQVDYNYNPKWIFKVNARVRETFGDSTIPTYGMAELGIGLGTMYNEVDRSDEIRKTYNDAFEEDLIERKRNAYAVVRNYAILAGGVGATPIPFVDSVGLILVQTTMIARINTMYGISLSRNLISTLISAVVTAPNALSVIGVTSLVLSYGIDDVLKLIPGLNIVGSIVGAGVAASFTSFLGFIVVKALENLIRKFPNYRSLSPEEIQEILVAEAQRESKTITKAQVDKKLKADS